MATCNVCEETLTLKRGKVFCMNCDKDETLLQIILNLEYLGLAEIVLDENEYTGNKFDGLLR